MDLDLDGRVAVVTGASKGIGLAVTRTLMQEKASVVATSRSRTPELDALGGSLVHVPADLMDPNAPAEALARAVAASTSWSTTPAGRRPASSSRGSGSSSSPTRTGETCSSSTSTRRSAPAVPRFR